MPKASPITRIGFTEGVKSSLDPSVVPVNALWRARNISLNESGLIRIRSGSKDYTEHLGHGPCIQGMVDAFDGILFAWNQNLYHVDTNTGIMTTIDDTQQLGQDASVLVEFVRWSLGEDEIVYIFAGNGIWQTDGTELKLVEPLEPAPGEDENLINDDGEQKLDSGPARCTFAILRKSLSQRIVASGDPKSPNTVYMSAPFGEGASYWPHTQTIQLPNDGDKIVGLANWYNSIIIFRQRDIWAFIGTDATDPNRLLVMQTSSIGCVSRRTIVQVPSVGIFFLGPDNVYAFDQVVAIENRAEVHAMADEIHKQLLPAISDSSSTAHAIYYDREYRLCFPFTKEEEAVFRLNFIHSPNWFIDTGPRTRQFVVRRDGPNKDVLYAGKRSEGQLIRFEDGVLTDSGKEIPVYVAFRRETLQPGPARIKRLRIYALAKGRRVEEELSWFGDAFNAFGFNDEIEEDATIITGTTQNLKVTLVVDGNEFSVETLTIRIRRVGSLILSEMEPVIIQEARFRPSLKGHFIQVRIESLEPEEDIAIIGYGIEYSTSGRIQGVQEGVTQDG